MQLRWGGVVPQTSLQDLGAVNGACLAAVVFLFFLVVFTVSERTLALFTCVDDLTPMPPPPLR